MPTSIPKKKGEVNLKDMTLDDIKNIDLSNLALTDEQLREIARKVPSRSNEVIEKLKLQRQSI